MDALRGVGELLTVTMAVNVREKTTMGTPTRHHFIPRRHPEGFCQEGFLSAYEGEKGEYRRPTPKSTRLQTYFYSLEDEHSNNYAVI